MALEGTDTVQAVETSLRIVDALAELGGASTAEIASYLNLPNSTVHAHLRTLHRNEYVVNRRGTYHVALRFFEVGQRARSRHGIAAVAVEELEKLAERTGEMASLLIEEHGRGTFVYSVHGTNGERTFSRIGRRIHLHATSSGKAILAYLSPGDARTIIDRHGLESYTPNTITTRDALFDELQTVRTQGYAVDDEERRLGFFCTAVPVLTEEDVLGAVSVSGPKLRIMNEWSVEELAAHIDETTTNIEFNVTGI